MEEQKRLQLPSPWFTTDIQAYLDEHHLLLYMEDAVFQLLSLHAQQDQSKVNSGKFFKEYFQRVHQGTHVIQREYKFVAATPHNRASFIKLLWTAFHNIHTRGDKISGLHFLSLVQILCADFSKTVIEHTCRLMGANSTIDEEKEFLPFFNTFRMVFYYEEFLNQAEDIFSRQAQFDSGSEQVNLTTEIDAELFRHHLELDCKKISVPSPSTLEDVVQGNTISYLEFIKRLCSHKSIGELFANSVN